MNQKKLITALVVSVLIFGGITIYFLTAQKSIAPVVQSTPVTLVVQDENANWQTYSSAEYGFEFKYPQNWIMKLLEQDGFVLNLISPETETKIKEVGEHPTADVSIFYYESVACMEVG